MWSVLLGIVCVLLMISRFMWKLSTQAILLYCLERGVKIAADDIRAYRMKVIEKRFGAKKSQNNS